MAEINNLSLTKQEKQQIDQLLEEFVAKHIKDFENSYQNDVALGALNNKNIFSLINFIKNDKAAFESKLSISAFSNALYEKEPNLDEDNLILYIVEVLHSKFPVAYMLCKFQCFSELAEFDKGVDVSPDDYRQDVISECDLLFPYPSALDEQIEIILNDFMPDNYKEEL